jgi:hypothetical protein
MAQARNHTCIDGRQDAQRNQALRLGLVEMREVTLKGVCQLTALPPCPL